MGGEGKDISLELWVVGAMRMRGRREVLLRFWDSESLIMIKERKCKEERKIFTDVVNSGPRF